MESVIERVDDAYRVCLYCKAKVQKQTVSVFLKNRQYDEKKIDLIDQMYLFYFATCTVRLWKLNMYVEMRILRNGEG